MSTTTQTEFTLIEGEDPLTDEVEELDEGIEQEETDEAETPSAEEASATLSPQNSTPSTVTAVQSSHPQEEAFTTKDPYDLAECQVTFAVSLFPTNSEDGSRMATVGIRNHADTPIIKVINGFSPAKLEEVFTELYQELESQMAFRKLEASKRPKQMIGTAATVRPAVVNRAPSLPNKPGSPPSPTTKVASNNQLGLFDM